MTATQEAWARYRRQEYAQALTEFENCLSTNPDDYSARLGIGRCHRLLGALDAAAEDFAQAHALRPEQARPLCERGAILILQHRWAETEACYEEARRREPEYSGLNAYFAELYLFTGRPAEALALSQAAALSEPDNLMHRINIAHAHLLLGRVDRARSQYHALAEEFHPVKQRTGAALINEDLRLLRTAGVSLPAGGPSVAPAESAGRSPRIVG